MQNLQQLQQRFPTLPTRINRLDQAIYESEQELANGAEAIDAEVVFDNLYVCFK